MNLDQIHNVYFLGIGGIGMSALARYFNNTGKRVAGYDRAQSELTDELSSSGIEIHYDENINQIPSGFLEKDKTLIVYTPAVPSEHKELVYFRNNGFIIHKRAEILGLITGDKRAICIAGTHGKTTTTTMVAYLMHHSELGCSAFLGGISKNFKTNLLLSDTSEFVVAEADEYDRSFLKLHPEIAIITSIDADHLDIYGNHEEVIKSFEAFAGQIKRNGILVIKKGVHIHFKNPGVKIYTYSLSDKADYYAENIRLENNCYHFDLLTPVEIIKNLSLRHPGIVNVENAVAAVAAVTLAGVGKEIITDMLRNFSGVKRRLDHIVKTENSIFIDDYAHHPKEIEAAINSVKKLYPGKKITGIFQPHLYSRTRDFAAGFSESLSLLDELILLDIYPARELPIEGVTSELIFKNVKIIDKHLVSKRELLAFLKPRTFEVILTMGAGDIDQFIEPIKNLICEKIR